MQVFWFLRLLTSHTSAWHVSETLFASQLSLVLCRFTLDPAWGDSILRVSKGFSGGSVVKNPPANAGDVRDVGSIPGSERSPGKKEMTTHSSIFDWRIPCTKEPGELQFSSVAQSCPTLWPLGPQHARPPRPSPTPGVYARATVHGVAKGSDRT